MHGAMHTGDQIILVAGALSLLAVFAGFASNRIGSPLLLTLIGVGMLAGGPGGIHFRDFRLAYLVGSISLAVILFQGGIGVERKMIRHATGTALVLATFGVLVSATVIAATAVLVFGASWPEGMLLGATTAPTDAAALSVLLRVSGIQVPDRVRGVVELESGINDPMSVFLTLAMIRRLQHPGMVSIGAGALSFLREMGGGAVIGLAAGYLLLRLFRLMGMRRSAFPLLALGFALTVFGGAQLIDASGFMAVYLTGVVVGNYEHPAARPVTRFFESINWLAQNSLFLMLGLLVQPQRLLSVLGPAILVTVVLVLIARPVAVCLSLLPFRWGARESAWISWAGLRGGVPIYLTFLPLLLGVRSGERLFNIVFVVVVVSVAVQGTTVKPLARRLGLHSGES